MRMSAPTTSMRLLAVTLGVMLALLLAVDFTAGSTDAACSFCHQDHREALEEGPHVSASCLSCHLEAGLWSLPGYKAGQWTGMYPAYMFGSEPGPAERISRQACISCHEGIDGVLVESGGLRIDHDACAAAPRSCDSCHGGVAHGALARWPQEPVMEECVACHDESSAPRECDDCHDGRLQTERLTRGPWRVTHGPEWRETHGMGEYEYCVTCHESDFCGGCHGVAVPHPQAFGSQHGRLALDEDAACETCHTREVFCDACHGVKMPHPAGYLRAHSTDAVSSDDGRCLSCHPESACVRCHVRHVHPGGAVFDEGVGVRDGS